MRLPLGPVRDPVREVPGQGVAEHGDCFSLGSALAATVLAAHIGDNDQPAVGGYTLVLWISAGFCVLAAALAWFLPARSTRLPPAERLAAEETRLVEQIDGDDLSA
ncbi:hypothetical protein [Streptomyces prunicolor]|uniref:hypothetical protein n=1 Tax=Streptomyces prunicolor TaxID=67348 RepID=UPI0033DC9B56